MRWFWRCAGGAIRLPIPLASRTRAWRSSVANTAVAVELEDSVQAGRGIAATDIGKASSVPTGARLLCTNEVVRVAVDTGTLEESRAEQITEGIIAGIHLR